MPSAEVNQQAKNNGQWGENVALDILNDKFNDVQFINDTIDFYADNGILIEVKTCQYVINRCDDKGDKRFGRFTFNPDQHEILLNKDGYYLLIVKNGDLVIKAKVIQACDVFQWMTNFQRKVCWRSLIG